MSRDGEKELTLQNSQFIHNEKVQHAKQQKGMTYKQKIIQPKKGDWEITYVIKLSSKTLEIANKYASYAQEGRQRWICYVKDEKRLKKKALNKISREENGNAWRQNTQKRLA